MWVPFKLVSSVNKICALTSRNVFEGFVTLITTSRCFLIPSVVNDSLTAALTSMLTFPSFMGIVMKGTDRVDWDPTLTSWRNFPRLEAELHTCSVSISSTRTLRPKQRWRDWQHLHMCIWIQTKDLFRLPAFTDYPDLCYDKYTPQSQCSGCLSNPAWWEVIKAAEQNQCCFRDSL